MASPQSPSTRTRLVNRRAAVALAALTLTLVALLVSQYFLGARRQRDALLRQADSLIRDRQYSLAIRHLDRYLSLHPDDPAVLAATAHAYQAYFGSDGPLGTLAGVSLDEVLAAIRINERLQRLLPNDSPEADPTRRRLAGLYIQYSDALPNLQFARFFSERATQESRYGAAQAIASDLARRYPNDPEAHLLLARSLDGLAVPSKPDILAQAFNEYHQTLQLDPKNLDAATRLARLYRDRYQGHDLPPDQKSSQTDASLRRAGRDRALAVLDSLLKARPGDPDVHLVRYRFFVEGRADSDLARRELRTALQLAPNSSWVRLAAAEQAIRDGRPEEARDHIAAIEKASSNEPKPGDNPRDTQFRAQILRGLAEFADKSPYSALVQWRQGLLQFGGTHAELNWWMAYVQLRLGQPGDADTYIAQYRRLVGADRDPAYEFLLALRHEQLGEWTEALRILDGIRYNAADPRLGQEVPLAIGRCREALGDSSGALAAYREAETIDPGSAIPKLAAASVQARRDPERALIDLRIAYANSPESPEILIALAQAEILRLARRNPAERLFAELDEYLDQLQRLEPDNPSLALLRADRLTLDPNSPGGASKLLEQAVAKRPSDRVLWSAWAEALTAEGQPQQALQILQRATETAGDHADLRLVRARLLTRLGRGRDAQNALVSNIQNLSPDQQGTLYEALGRLRASQGDLLGARDAYTRWAATLPGSPAPLTALIEVAIRLGDRPTAERLLLDFDRLSSRSTTQLPPGSQPRSSAGLLAGAMIKAYFADANVDPSTTAGRLAIIKELTDANQYLALLKIPEPDRPDQGRVTADPTAFAIRGRIYERLASLEPDQPNHLRLAIANYQQAWAAGITDVLPRLVDLLARAGRVEEIDQLTAKAPNPNAVRLSAQALILNGQRARGDDLIRQLAPPNTGRGDLWRGRMLEMAGRFDDLEAELQLRARAARADDLEPWFLLLRTQAERNRPPDVIEATIRDFLARARTPHPTLLEPQARFLARQWLAADRAYEKAIATSPNDPVVLATAANHFADTGRTTRAAELFRAALAAQPNARPAARDFAVLLSGLGDPASWNEAWALVQPEASPDNLPEDRLARSIVLARSTDPQHQQQALELLTELLADLDPASPVASAARDYITRLLLARGEPHRAASYALVSSTVTGRPNDLALHAECLLAAKQYRAAEDELDRLFLLAPLSTDEARLRAQLLLERAGPERLASAVADRPGLPSFTLGQAAFELLLAPPEPSPNALAAADQIARLLASRNPAFSWMNARILLLQNRPADALAAAKTAAETPDATESDRAQAAQAALAAAAREPSLREPAASLLDTALRYQPASPELLALRALLHHEFGQYDAEVRLYRRVLELAPPGHPESSTVAHNLAWTLSEGLNLPAEALPLIDGLIRSQGPNPSLLCTRGLILSRLGQHDRALADLRESIRLEPNPVRLYYLARAYLAAGQKDQARQCLDQAKQAGLTPDQLDRTEQASFRALMAL